VLENRKNVSEKNQKRLADGAIRCIRMGVDGRRNRPETEGNRILWKIASINKNDCSIVKTA